ncbi:hypothetical protein LTR36_009004 [Oleoguttula mirabilis]|uniref:Amidase domain-containing protein n=1 Tax=Oleoguttula mirabilis TaxID=1507867 RepID=A0AAV9J700_9PEZI|nr:hypothetical protein LTR36_009004 [Oleoguttula mirabilis]
MIDVTLEDLVYGLETGLFTSVDLVRTYMDRILEVNGTLHMVTELNPDALTIAAELDLQRAAGNVTGPLHGIPVLIKNNIATHDLMNNTAGSFALLGAKVPRDSTMAAKLRKAGAVILGKSNLSQWANYRSDNTSNGWSAYGGQTEAAYYPHQDPSGSSSGSGVSSSIGLAWAALGTETDGSILSPSEMNNLVGIKPTVGLTSRYLVIPISEHQDTVGPMARSVKDAAYLLSAIAGSDTRDNYTTANPNGNRTIKYVSACDYNALRGVRLGVPWNVINYYASDGNLSATYLNNPSTIPVIAAFNTSLSLMASAGAIIVPTNITVPGAYNSGGNETIVLDADFPVNLANYLSELTYNPNNITSLADLRNFTEHFPAEQWSLTARDVGIWNESLALGFNNTSPEFWKAWEADQYLGGEAGLFGAIARDNLSAVLLPTQFSPSFAAIVGAPGITVPMGFYPANTTVTMNGFGNLVAQAPGVPFGLSFLGAKWTEYQLISYAYAFEQRSRVRNQVQPYLVPNIELADVVGST